MRIAALLAAFALSAVVVGQADARLKAPKTIKEVMTEGHKGKPALCGLCSQGKATKEDCTKLLALYKDMAEQKPSKGDAAEWKKKCETLIAATTKLAEDPANKDAVAAYKAAVNCKACHDAHK